MRLNVQVIAERRDGSRREIGYQGMGGRYDFERLLDPLQWQPLVDEAVRVATLNLEAKPCPAGAMTVVLADDLTVFNLTKDHIEIREVTFNHDAWPQGTSKGWDTAPRGEPATNLMSDWLTKGELKGVNPPPTQPLE